METIVSHREMPHLQYILRCRSQLQQGILAFQDYEYHATILLHILYKDWQNCPFFAKILRYL